MIRAVLGLFAALALVVPAIVVVSLALFRTPDVTFYTSGDIRGFGGKMQYGIVAEECLPALGLARRSVAPDDNAAMLYLTACEAFTPYPPVKGNGQQTVYAGDLVHSGSAGFKEEAVRNARDGVWDPANTDLAEWLDRNAQAIAMLHEAGRKPDCLLPFLVESCRVKTRKWRGVASLWDYPNPSGWVGLADVLALAAARSVHEGDVQGAVEHLLALHRMGTHLCRNEPRSTCHFTSAMIVSNLATRALHRLVCAGVADAAALRMLAGALAERLTPFAVWPSVLRDERRWCIRLLAETKQGYDLVHSSNIRSRCRAVAARARANVLDSRLRTQINGLFDAWDRHAAQALTDPAGAMSAKALLALKQASKTADAVEQGLRERVYLPSYRDFLRDAMNGQALHGLLYVGIAIRLYHAEHNTFPPTLQDLVPDLLPALPADPFTTRDFLYRLTENRFVLYSVGRDLKDDGGSTAADLVFCGGDVTGTGE